MKYDQLPEHMRGGAQRYIEHGIVHGDFLTAVLENDFVGAYGMADEINTACMRDWASWLYNDCPSAAWGSHEIVIAWIESGGIGGEHDTV